MNTKPIWKSKTFWFNLMAALAPLVAYLAANPAFIQQVAPVHYVTYIGAIGVINIVLRIVTTTGVTLFSSVPAP